MIVRSKTLAGFDAPYVPGWDCHGCRSSTRSRLPTASTSPPTAPASSAASTLPSRSKQKTEFIRLGVLGDWDNPYKTMNFANEAGEIRALAEMVKQGFVFKGLKPVTGALIAVRRWLKRKSSTPTRSRRPSTWLPGCR